MRHSAANWAMRRKLGSAPVTVASMSSTISSSASFSLKILTALIGSPTYFGSLKRVVLTRPPLCTSRHGMMRGRSTSEFREVLQELRPEVVALLGMELHAVDVAGVDGAAEVDAVAGDGGDVFLALAFEVERMQEVEAGVGAQAF